MTNNHSTIDPESQKALEFAKAMIENVTVGKTAAHFNKFFTLRKLADIYSTCLNRSYSYERIRQLIVMYGKRGEKS
jgi:hypothetical protein